MRMPTEEEATLAAKDIVGLWINYIQADPSVALFGELAKAASDSTVMHDTCDANMVFDAVLVRMGICDPLESLPESGEPETEESLIAYDKRREESDKAWNFVTANPLGFLE